MANKSRHDSFAAEKVEPARERVDTLKPHKPQKINQISSAGSTTFNKTPPPLKKYQSDANMQVRPLQESEMRIEDSSAKQSLWRQGTAFEKYTFKQASELSPSLHVGN